MHFSLFLLLSYEVHNMHRESLNMLSAVDILWFFFKSHSKPICLLGPDQFQRPSRSMIVSACIYDTPMLSWNCFNNVSSARIQRRPAPLVAHAARPLDKRRCRFGRYNILAPYPAY